MSDDVKKVLKMIEDNDVKFVDFRFTDPKGKWQHTAQTVETIDEELLTDGIMFDGSSIAGWRAINESDMNLKPDLSTAVMDLFPSQPQLILFCDVLEPLTGQPYSRDPRSTAKKADSYLAASGIGDTAYFGAEAEFFVFDSVRFSTAQEHTFYKIDSEEGPWSSSEEFAAGNQGHRPAAKGVSRPRISAIRSTFSCCGCWGGYSPFAARSVTASSVPRCPRPAPSTSIYARRTGAPSVS